MFKREKRMHSFIIRAQEILADGKREESAKMVIQGLQHYSNKIIGAIQPYSKADATLLVIALRYLADQVEQKNGCALAVKALSKTIEFPELEEVEKVKKAAEVEEMKNIRFTVKGNPFGKERPKFARRGNFVQTYTPKNTLQHEKEVAAVYMEAAKGRKFEKGKPLDIRIIAYYPIPKSTSKKKQREMLEHRLRPTVKPDLDNVAKLVYDALNGVAWYDDNAIVDTQVRKFYSDTPRVEVFIRAVE